MGFIVHVGASVVCPHAGQMTAITTNTRVFVGTQPVVTQADLFTIAGCGTLTNPCVIVKWIVPSLRISVNGQRVILQNSVGICQSGDQTPRGPPNVIATQTRARGT